MKTPREVYAQYNIMPSLQLHQLRVAAVGKLICDNFNPPASGAVNSTDVVLACLFHDMGNIVKFNLDAFTKFVEPEGVEYWKKVQAETIQKYGPEQHHVSEAIAGELGLPPMVIHMIGNSGASRIPEIVASNSSELKVLQYADLRVAPTGVVSLVGRFEDFARRYPIDKDADLIPVAKKLEEQIFTNTTIKPEDITDAAVAPLIEELWEYALA